MEGLGRLFNLVPTADAVEVNLRDAGGVTFVCVGADTYTIQESTSSAGAGAQDLLAWDHWFTNTGAVGATAWVEASDATPAAAAIIAANAAIYVSATELSDGFDFIQCNSAAGGLVIAIVHDLVVQRNPANLPALGV
jgi:hypothetical protein